MSIRLHSPSRWPVRISRSPGGAIPWGDPARNSEFHPHRTIVALHVLATHAQPPRSLGNREPNPELGDRPKVRVEGARRASHRFSLAIERNLGRRNTCLKKVEIVGQAPVSFVVVAVRGRQDDDDSANPSSDSGTITLVRSQLSPPRAHLVGDDPPQYLKRALFIVNSTDFALEHIVEIRPNAALHNVIGGVFDIGYAPQPQSLSCIVQQLSFAALEQLADRAKLQVGPFRYELEPPFLDGSRLTVFGSFRGANTAALCDNARWSLPASTLLAEPDCYRDTD